MMKKNSKKSVLLISVLFVLSIVFTGCGSANSSKSNTTSDVDISSLPIYPMRASFVYDTNDMRQAVGICDYVFVGEVISCDGTQYRDKVTMEDDNGNPKEVGSPYTNYTVNVIENIKGELVTEQSISITKQGGVSENQDAVYVFENDELPVANNTYIFLAYAQEDGSLLISGPNSNVLYNNAETYSTTSTSAYQEYKTAVENEVIPVERERFTSGYEGSTTE